MYISTTFLLFLVVATVMCTALPHHHKESPQQKEEQQEQLFRQRRSPEGKHAKVGVYEDSRKGAVAKVEGSGTIWESKDKQLKAKAGVDYTQPLGHGRGEGSAFIKVEGTF